MKYTQRGFIVQGVVAIVALVLIASGAYYVSEKKVSAPVVENTDTTDWKTYTNARLGYEVKYPADWTVRERDGDFVSIVSSKYPGKDDTDIPYENVSVILLQKGECSATEWKSGGNGFAGDETDSFKTICVSGNEKIAVSLLSMEDSSKRIEDKIASTFKFTSSSATTEWKTYTNEGLGFSIAFPPTWDGYYAQEGTSEVSFGFDDKNAKFGSLLHIEKITQADWIQEQKSEVRPQFLAERDGAVFVYTHANGDPESLNPQIHTSDFSKIISTFKLVSPATTPFITSISPTAGPIGTKVELKGTGFSGFEGDKYAWIENIETGAKGIIYNDPGATNNFIPFTLKDKYCTRDNSYSGNPCESYLTITPGEYTIHVYPWGKISNKIKFTVTQTNSIPEKIATYTEETSPTPFIISKSNWGISFPLPSDLTIVSASDNRIILTQTSSGDQITLDYTKSYSYTDIDSKFGSVTYSFNDVSGKWYQLKDNESGNGQTNVEAVPIKMVKNILPVFQGTSRWATYIIALSTNEFLKINITGSGETSSINKIVDAMTIIN